jgi:hypothetical protein
MKRLGFLILLGLVQACDPYGFGFENNPASVLNKAFESVQALDHEAFLEVSGKEALCLYGNAEGVNYLRTNLNINSESVEFKSKLLENSSKYTNIPRFVGYWSYYEDSYLIDILDKATKEALIKVLVECHYGFEGEKNEKYQNLKLKKYKVKECRVIKMIPFKFPALPMREECRPLKIDL